MKLTAVTLKIIFWDVTSCSLVQIHKKNSKKNNAFITSFEGIGCTFLDNLAKFLSTRRQIPHG